MLTNLYSFPCPNQMSSLAARSEVALSTASSQGSTIKGCLKRKISFIFNDDICIMFCQKIILWVSFYIAIHRYYLSVMIDIRRALIELVQHSANRGSSHRPNIASVRYSIWFGYIARLSQWGGRGPQKDYSIHGVPKCLSLRRNQHTRLWGREWGDTIRTTGQKTWHSVYSVEGDFHLLSLFLPAFAVATGGVGGEAAPCEYYAREKLSHFGQETPVYSMYTHIAARGQTAAYLSEPERTAAQDQ